MRLDKLLSVTATASRTEAKKAVRAGAVTVNGRPAVGADQQIDPERDEILFRGEPVHYAAFHYVLLHKPDGVVSATEDGREPTVLDLLPEKYTALGLFPCGRLDKHTTGLMLLTDDGGLAHRLLSPARHVDKTYRFTVKFPLSAADVAALESGVDIGGYVTAPARVALDPPADGVQKSGLITLHEGKYHQIKLMMAARHNQVRSLKRLTFGPLSLPDDLPPGGWRELTPAELDALREAGG